MLLRGRDRRRYSSSARCRRVSTIAQPRLQADRHSTPRTDSDPVGQVGGAHPMQHAGLYAGPGGLGVGTPSRLQVVQIGQCDLWAISSVLVSAISSAIGAPLLASCRQIGGWPAGRAQRANPSTGRGTPRPPVDLSLLLAGLPACGSPRPRIAALSLRFSCLPGTVAPVAWQRPHPVTVAGAAVLEADSKEIPMAACHIPSSPAFAGTNKNPLALLRASLSRHGVKQQEGTP